MNDSPASPLRPNGARPAAPHIIGIGGTTRIGSSSEAALRYTLALLADMGASTELIAGPLIDLPMYDPADAHRSPGARRLVQAFKKADGVVIATPSYHGALSGVIKNALDYVEDLRSDSRPYLDGRGVGIVVTAHGAQALGTTLMGVRSIVHALRGWPTPFAATLNAQHKPFENGLPANAEVAEQLRTVADQVYRFARAQQMLRENDPPAPATDREQTHAA